MTPVTVVVDGQRFSLYALDVGLACCAVEFVAATGQLVDDHAVDAKTAPHVLVVSGTVTHAMAGGVRALYDAMPEPRHVVAFGACTITGGPYWDSYAVVPGIDALVPVDVVIPGCPPRPEALIDGLMLLAQRVGA